MLLINPGSEILIRLRSNRQSDTSLRIRILIFIEDNLYYLINPHFPVYILQCFISALLALPKRSNYPWI